MGWFVKPPPLEPSLRQMLDEMRALDAWAAQFEFPHLFKNAAPSKPRRKRATPRQVRAIVRGLDKAGLNLGRIEIDSTSGRVTALVNSGGEPANGADNDLDAEIAQIDRRLYGEPRK